MGPWAAAFGRSCRTCSWWSSCCSSHTACSARSVSSVCSAIAARPASAPVRKGPLPRWLEKFRPRIACGVYHSTYAEDMALRTTPAARIRLALVLAATLLFPFVASDYAVGEANRLGIAIIGALGLNILVGFTGQISVAQGAFLAIGGYTTAIMTVSLGLPFWLALPTAGITTAAVGALCGIPSLRLKGLYLLIATLAAQVIVEWLVLHLVWLTKGSNGIYGIKPPAIGPLEFSDRRAFYFLMLVLVIAAVLFAANLFRTRVGRAFVAIGGLGSISGAIYGAAFIRLLPAALSMLTATLGLGGANVGVLQQAVFGLAI